MAVSSSRLLWYSFVLIVISECLWAFKNVNIYPRYFVEDFCTYNENITYELSQTGRNSVAKIGAFRNQVSLYNARNCRIIIKPPDGYSVHLKIELLGFDVLCSLKSNCSNYIQVFDNNVAKSPKLFGSLPYLNLNSTSFTTHGNMTIIFHTQHDFLKVTPGFLLIATAYRESSCDNSTDYFSCKNGRCIWHDLICDAVNNCGDNSDEDASGLPHCSHDIDTEPFTFSPPDIKPFTFSLPEFTFNYDSVINSDIRSSHGVSYGAAGASVIFVILGAIIRFYCYYQCRQANRQQIVSALTIIRARTVLRNTSMNGTPPPPPYETLVNDPESPPEYTAVNIPPPSSVPPCNPENNSAPTHPPPTAKNKSTASEPPPPYEP